MQMKHFAVALTGWLPAASLASDAGTVTGITNTGTATLIIGAAGGLLAAMVLRPVVATAARHAVHFLDGRALRRSMSGGALKALHDFIVPGAYGGLTRIDHAVLTPHGIVCVLYRDYRGLVFGAADDPQWTSVDGPKRQRFLNPVIQNQGRVAALRKALPDLAVDGVVVFNDRIEFQGDRPDGVLLIGELKDYLERHEAAGAAIEDWDSAWLSLSSAAMTDDETRKDLDAQLSFG